MESRFTDANPVGRIDVAAARVADMLARLWLDPVVYQAVVPQLMPYAEVGLEALMGPRTRLGRKSVVAVAAVRTVKGFLEMAAAPGQPGDASGLSGLGGER